MKRTAKISLALGVVLLCLSAYPLFLFIREVVASRQVHGRYEVRGHDSNSVVFQGNQISVTDDLDPEKQNSANKNAVTVKTFVNGRDYSLTTPIEVRHGFSDANRYWHWIALAQFTDRHAGVTEIVVVQRIDPNFGRLMNYHARLNAYRFRILFINSSGEVREETFGFLERGAPTYRTILAGLAFPTLIGFHTQAFAVLPTYLYPFFFPLVTAILGVILTIVSGDILVRGTLRPRDPNKGMQQT